MTVYKFGSAGKELVVMPSVFGGVKFATSPTGCLIPDDEIPDLVSALQNYMSKRAKEITKAATR